MGYVGPKGTPREHYQKPKFELLSKTTNPIFDLKISLDRTYQDIKLGS